MRRPRAPITGDDPVFPNRQVAGALLAAALLRYRDEDPLILGIPRGGVPVAKPSENKRIASSVCPAYRNWRWEP